MARAAAEADEGERALPGRGDRGVGVSAAGAPAGSNDAARERGEGRGGLPGDVAGAGAVLAVVDAEALRDPVASARWAARRRAVWTPPPVARWNQGKNHCTLRDLERVERRVGPQDLRVGLEVLEIEVGRAQLRLLVGDVAPAPAGAEEGVARLGRARGAGWSGCGGSACSFVGAAHGAGGVGEGEVRVVEGVAVARKSP